MPRPEWVQVGRILKAHGLQGEVRVAVESDNPARFAPGSRLFARPERVGTGLGGERRAVVVRQVRGESGDPIVAFEGVDDRDAAEGLRGSLLEIPAAELPEPGTDEYYPFDLEGLEVRTPDGRRMGVVKALLEAPANDVLVVTPDARPGGELLLPFVMAAIPEIDVEGGYIVVVESFMRPPD